MSVYVNRVEISESDIGQEMQYHPAPSQERAWQLAAQSLVIRQLLLQQAEEDGYYTVEADAPKANPAEEEAIDRLLEENISVPEADEKTCRRFYDNHPESFLDDESGERLAFDQAQLQIRDYLYTKAMRMAVAEYIKALSYQAEIKGIELVNL
jgi:peptidyl-prolyl cis-trans isomerase C